MKVDVEGFEPGKVLTSEGPLEADLVVLGIGVRPRSELAAAAGIEIGVADAIRVDDRQATSVEGVWSAGDCAESTHLVTGQPVYIALGTYANRHGRVAGLNMAGGDVRSPHVLGTAITKLCQLGIAITGLTERAAVEAGFDAVAATIDATTKAGYFSDAEQVTVRMTAERGTGRLLGAQILGADTAAKRIDTVATAITAGMTVDAGGRPRPRLRAAVLLGVGPGGGGRQGGDEARVTPSRSREGSAHDDASNGGELRASPVAPSSATPTTSPIGSRPTVGSAGP